MSEKKIAIVGCGVIGRSWAIAFAIGGYSVRMFDISSQQLVTTVSDIRKRLCHLRDQGGRYSGIDIDDVLGRIRVSSDISSALSEAIYVQECIVESLEAKKTVYLEIEKSIDENSIIASSTSGLLPTLLYGGLKNKQRAIVVHPCNPVDVVPIVEIVISKYTDRETLDSTKRIMESIGQLPVVLKKEIEGFALNRIQFAVVSECMHLVKEGVINVEDLEKIVTEALGPRYTCCGALETYVVDTRLPFHELCVQYSATFDELKTTMKPPMSLGGELAQNISRELSKTLPAGDIRDRASWREQRIAEIMELKRQSFS